MKVSGRSVVLASLLGVFSYAESVLANAKCWGSYLYNSTQYHEIVATDECTDSAATCQCTSGIYSGGIRFFRVECVSPNEARELVGEDQPGSIGITQVGCGDKNS